MAFNGFLTPAWIVSGQSIGWWYALNDNRGAQYAMANPKSPNAQMITTCGGNGLNDDGTLFYDVGFQDNGPRACSTISAAGASHEQGHRRQQCGWRHRGARARPSRP